MALFIAALNSGSNGNCYYVGNESEAVLVDAGISCRETVQRMQRLGLSMDRVKAIFISHEHSDHIRGLPALAQRFSLPVYISARTLRGCRFELPQARPLQASQPVQVGSLTVTPFAKCHDAADPCSFVIEGNGICVGVLTDIGAVCERVSHFFGQCQAVFLEANYDAEMLEKGRYPLHLKRRIRGGEGHLSNAEALALLLGHRPASLQHLVLSHLSQENNCPQKVEALFTAHAGDTHITVASRFRESPLLRVSAAAPAALQPFPAAPAIRQMSLFD